VTQVCLWRILHTKSASVRILASSVTSLGTYTHIYIYIYFTQQIITITNKKINAAFGQLVPGNDVLPSDYQNTSSSLQVRSSGVKAFSLPSRSCPLTVSSCTCRIAVDSPLSGICRGLNLWNVVQRPPARSCAHVVTVAGSTYFRIFLIRSISFSFSCFIFFLLSFIRSCCNHHPLNIWSVSAWRWGFASWLPVTHKWHAFSSKGKKGKGRYSSSLYIFYTTNNYKQKINAPFGQ